MTLTLLEPGPVRARARIVAAYRWPTHVDTNRHERVGETAVEVETIVEVGADDPAVRVTTSFTNPARDHRVRVVLPLPARAGWSDAECAFAVVRRGLVAEGRVDEFGLPTFPSRRFVSAGGLTVAHEGLLEYELVDVDGDGAGALALTLLRSTGMLSRLGMTYRPLPAGPLTPVDALQLAGRRIEARYAIAHEQADPYAMVDDAFLPLETVAAPGGGDRPATGAALHIDGAEVSAVRRVAGALEVRVFNPTADETRVDLGERSGWIVDLRGRPVAPFDGGFPLRPGGIATVRITEA